MENKYQGRDSKQYRSSAIGAGVGITGLILVFIYLLITNL